MKMKTNESTVEIDAGKLLGLVGRGSLDGGIQLGRAGGLWRECSGHCERLGRGEKDRLQQEEEKESIKN